jgi:hypothetical protein
LRLELKIGDRCERSHKIREYRNVPAEEHRVLRAHEWFDLLDDECDQATAPIEPCLPMTSPSMIGGMANFLYSALYQEFLSARGRKDHHLS